MKIARKLLLTLNVVVLLVAGFGITAGISIIWIRWSADELKRVSRQEVLIEDLRTKASQWTITVDFIQKDNQFQDFFHLNTVLLEKRISSLIAESLPVGEKEEMEAISIIYNGIKEQIAGLPDKKQYQDKENLDTSVQKLLRHVEGLMSSHKLYLNAIKSRAERIRDIGKYVSISLPSVCIVLAIFLGLTIGRNIIRPVKHLISLTQAIAGGDLSRKEALRTRNEFGELAMAFDNMRMELKRDRCNLKLSEEELKKAKDYTDNIIKSMMDTLIVINRDGKIKTVNKATSDVLGYREDELIGNPVAMIFAEDSPLHIMTLLDELTKKGFIYNAEETYVSKDGGKIPVLFSASTMFDKDDNFQGVVFIALDITERKKIEQQLVHAQKMESIGQLAAGIAHELNTPTQFISANIFFLQDAFSKVSTLLKKRSYLLEMNKAGSVTPEMISEMNVAEKDVNLEYLIEEIPAAINESLEGLRRVTEIVQSMKNFSYPDVGEKETVDINTMIKSTITVSRNEWKYVADTETDFDADLPHVSCYRGEFNQVILNLIVNAAHAIGEVSGNGEVNKGKIGISTRHDGDWVEIRISDTGAGIPEENRSRIFEPFFTTKEVGKGTGQGLSIAHSVIVKKHNGIIDFVSERGKGTTFIIRLPTSTSQVESKE